jgi:hypothetical protein
MIFIDRPPQPSDQLHKVDAEKLVVDDSFSRTAVAAPFSGFETGHMTSGRGVLPSAVVPVPQSTQPASMEMTDDYAEVQDPWSIPAPPPSLLHSGQDNRFDERAFRSGFQSEFMNQLGGSDNANRDWQQHQQDEVSHWS